MLKKIKLFCKKFNFFIFKIEVFGPIQFESSMNVEDYDKTREEQEGKSLQIYRFINRAEKARESENSFDFEN
jgi:hypothetical protein